MAHVDQTYTTDHRAARAPAPAVAAEQVTARRVWWAELGVAWVLLLIVGVAAFATNIRDSGFSSDDWANAVRTLQTPGGVGNVISAYADITAFRPLLILYVPLTYWVFGTHMGFHLAWSVALAIFMSGMLYGLLRECGLRRVHSFLVAALLLVYPWADSTRMWPTGSMASLAIGLGLAGVWVALVGLRRDSWRVHAVAVALYLASILTYEITALLIVAAGLLYIVRHGWRAARLRWGADLVAVIAAAVWNSSTTARPHAFDLAALWSHFRLIVQQGGTLVARSAVPVGRPSTALVLLVLLGLCIVAGTLAWARRGRPLAAALRPWLLLGLGGAVVVVAGWAIFTPTDAYYTPSVYGFTNRVNALAAVGLVMFLYAAAGVVGTLVGRVAPRLPVVATATTVVVAVILGAGYTKVLERHSDLWVGAFRGEMGALRQVAAQYPTMPSHSTVLTFGYPGYQAPGVPIFDLTWDLSSALKLHYDDPSVSGYPVVAPAHVRCTRKGVLAGGGAISGLPPIPYGRAILLDVRTGRHVAPTDAAGCRRALPGFVPGPLELSADY